MPIKKYVAVSITITIIVFTMMLWLVEDGQQPPPVPIVIPRLPIGSLQKKSRDLESKRDVPSETIEIYMTNTEFVKLYDESFLKSTPWEEWPPWVFTVLTNFAYSKKFGYQFSLWVPPPTSVCGYWTRGWGNVLVGQYLSERSTEGSYRKSDWLMYLDSDAFFNEPDISLKQFLSTTSFKRSIQSHEEGGRLPFGVSRPLLDFDYITSLEDTSLIASSEHPIESVWELVDEWGYLNSGVFLLNMNNENTPTLVSEWSQSVATGTCHKRFRTTRIAEQSCLDSLMFRNETTSTKFKPLLGIAEFALLNSPAGKFVRHPWDVKELNDLSWMTYGWPFMSMAGVFTKSEAIELANELLDSVMIRRLPMRFGDNSPGWEGTFQWPILQKDVIKAAVEISQKGGKDGKGFKEFQSQQLGRLLTDFDELFSSDSAESCLVVVITASPNCLLVTWVASDGSCYCAGDSDQIVTLKTTRNALTWVSNSITVSQ
eukprot:TRINITY_DN10540_c0_g1_i1.p1 TRINITY_DN10540_c0_g1~~TRINITY_DN10540_c0_g1_i1.p1  ORF type:complete len:504 (+),score=75.97 TRINITY_DN10540_c0_g1_i1:59-1513(+)